MNSFRFIERGIRAEIARQTAIVERRRRVQETLHFDPRTEAITSLRSKEEAHDYRYFPEPDLVPMPDPGRCSSAPGAMPELPSTASARLIDDVGPPAEQARLLAFRPNWATSSRRRWRPRRRYPQPPRSAHHANKLLARYGTGPRAPPKVTPAALAESVALPAGQGDHAARRHQSSTSSIPKVVTLPPIVEAEGLGAIGGRRRVGPIVEAALDSKPRRSREAEGRGHEPDRRDHRRT